MNPFSYVVLTLVGRSGATAPELAEMMDRGRLYWSAARSQWYAEPKRLTASGHLEAREEPGRTGPRVRYHLTPKGHAAVADWVRTPVGLPKIQHEAVVRVLAADLADDPADVLVGLAPLRAEIAEERQLLERSRVAAGEVPGRSARLQAQQRMVARMLDALADWTDDVERAIGRDAAPPS
jgi:DNA-binding PadR family transcriptional regulator